MFPLALSAFADLMAIDVSFDMPVTGVSVDSRHVLAGHLFFALPGVKVDGHDYLPEVAAKQAVAAVVQESYAGDDYGMPLLRVPDVLQALQLAAQQWLQQVKPQVVAITGSIGKTTTKEFVATLLRSRYRVCASPGNQNSQIGLPLSIFTLKKTDEIFVAEMGMTGPGHITKLIECAPPDIAVITYVDLVHAGFFDSLEEIARAKAEILQHSKTRIGIIYQHLAHHHVVWPVGTCLKVGFSLSSPASDYYLHSSEGQVTVYEAGELIFQSPWSLFGKHHLHNFLAAVAVARSLDISGREIAAAIPQLQLPDRRCQVMEKRGVIWVNDSYNACAASVCAALENLPPPQPGRKRIAVLGAMGELGKFSEQCHREVGGFALERIDQLFCLGEECEPMRALWESSGKSVQQFNCRQQLLEALRKIVQAGDVVLVKGSRYHRLWEIIDLV